MYHALSDCTKLKTSPHKQCKTGEIQAFVCIMAKQAFVGLQVTNNSFSKFHFRDICTATTPALFKSCETSWVEEQLVEAIFVDSGSHTRLF